MIIRIQISVNPASVEVGNEIMQIWLVTQCEASEA